jgi:hypothetical protein
LLIGGPISTKTISSIYCVPIGSSRQGKTDLLVLFGVATTATATAFALALALVHGTQIASRKTGRNCPHSRQQQGLAVLGRIRTKEGLKIENRRSCINSLGFRSREKNCQML